MIVQPFADTAAHRDVAGEAPQAAFRPDVTVDRITSGLPANATAHDDNAIKRFVTAVYVTLFSEPHGYDSLPRLLHDLRYARASGRGITAGVYRNYRVSN